MALRNKSGGTLSLVIISTFVLALIGSCFFLIAKILGGAREAQHATDSGGLNVAKQAIKRPGYALGGSDEDNFISLRDPQTGDVNLEVYNRLTGRALLVAMNASADGNSTGITNANTLLRVLQGPSGIGSNLGGQLGVGGGGGQLGGFFSNLAGQNTTRMLGQGSLGGQGVTAAYMEQRPGDVGATNLLVPRANQLPIVGLTGAPFAIQNSWLTTDPRIPNRQYIRGYAAMNIANINMPVVGVPVQPRHQPRLAATRDFEASRGQPVQGVQVPPNAFRSAAATQEDRSQGNLNTIACALVGIVDAQNNGKEYLPAIPDGYLRIFNAGGNAIPAGSNPAAFNLFDDELDPSIGVKVGGQGRGKHMTSTDGLLEQWDAYNRAKQADPNFQGQQPPLTDLYQADGRPATADSASQIRLQNPGSPDTVCTDRNTLQPIQGQGFPPENPECRQLLDSGAMDAAFSGDGPYTQNAGPSNDLLALEEVKCRVVDRFNDPGGISTALPQTTGMRLFRRIEAGGGRPWQAGTGMQRCQITEDGTLCELVAQAATGPMPDQLGGPAGMTAARTVRDFVRQRMCQMFPDVDLLEVDRLIGWPISAQADGWRSSDRSHLLPLSDTAYFLYVDYAAQGGPRPVLAQNLNNQTPPAWRNQAPDGTPGGPNGQWRFATQYLNIDDNTAGTINPRYEAGIHDRLFQCQSGECRAEDRALVTPSCGYRNILGEVTFQNRVVSFSNGGSLGESPQFSCPN
jgi:hypothetical protein